MSYADDVRNYCINNYINPARNNGETVVSIRAGDVHRGMMYNNRMPLVCSSIGANIFEETANIKRISVEGPTNGANAVYKFEILR
jgi:5-methylcytosine-specific restriction enzyme B